MTYKHKKTAGKIARALRDRADRPMPAAAACARDAVAYAAALEILG